LNNGRPAGEEEAGEASDRLLSAVRKPSRGRDRTLAEVLEKSKQPRIVKHWAAAHIEGFNAASRERVSTAALKADAEAADRIDGNHIFRLWEGYDALFLSILRSIRPDGFSLRLGTAVEGIEWARGSAKLFAHGLNDQKLVVRAKKLIVTVPLGVLRAAAGSKGAIQIDPSPRNILEAARRLEVGEVYRVTFRFDNAFWEDDERLAGFGLITSTEKVFPTWWSQHPVSAPVLTGWSAGPAAEPLIGLDADAVAVSALKSLSRMLNRKVPAPAAAYFHDWHSDPLSRGAYSYVPVHQVNARRALATPVQGTLFFAGEATETRGNAGTVHGAIASGIRAAGQVLKAG
jgi:hypothetical protein